MSTTSASPPVATAGASALAGGDLAGIADRGPHPASAVLTLARRRLALSARTPRELVVPLLTPVLFAVVIAPALKQALGGFRNGGVDYEAFVATATIGLLIPLNTMFAGIGVIVDRENGARRELLTAPIPRAL